MGYSIHSYEYRNARTGALAIGLLLYVAWVATLVICITDDFLLPLPMAYFAWSVGQCLIVVPQLSSWLTQKAWKSIEAKQPSLASEHCCQYQAPLAINVLHVQDVDNPLAYLESTYGKSWRDRPLLLKGLWPAPELQHNASRRLSPQGLLQMNLPIPYFTDATVEGALEPDAEAPVREIVKRIQEGHPHKIGSQLIVQADPTLLEEVAPHRLVTALFGDYFSIDRLLGHGKTFGMFPGITTVPVFVAKGNPASSPRQPLSQQNDPIPSKREARTCEAESQPLEVAKRRRFDNPVTGLHCEPIANVAVQLSGLRKWTLVDPQHSWMLRPAISADGRSFYPAWVDSLDHVPRYEAMTHPGDALFVPTWTWHRVDYVGRVDENSDGASNGRRSNVHDDISIGASLFHFRLLDYVRRNPLFAILLVPAIFGEAAGFRTQ